MERAPRIIPPAAGWSIGLPWGLASTAGWAGGGLMLGLASYRDIIVAG